MNFLVVVFFLVSLNAFGKTEIWKCDQYTIKINNPIIGFKKVFIEDDNNWIKIEDFQITKEKISVFNILPFQNKCQNKQCRVSLFISKVPLSGNFSEYILSVSNEFCEIDGANICFKRKFGLNLGKGYCNRI